MPGERYGRENADRRARRHRTAHPAAPGSGRRFYASSSPDALNKTANDTGFNAEQRDHDLADSPFAGYGTRGVDDGRMSTGMAGTVGVLATFVVAGGLFFVVKRHKSSP